MHLYGLLYEWDDVSPYCLVIASQVAKWNELVAINMLLWKAMAYDNKEFAKWIEDQHFCFKSQHAMFWVSNAMITTSYLTLRIYNIHEAQ